MEGQQLNYESNGNAGKAKPSCLYCQQRENNNAQDREMETGLLDDLVEWNPGKRVSHPSFFWRAHSVSVLVVLILCLCYVGLIEEPNTDSHYNIKRGVLAICLVFIAFGVTQARDGPFLRPHPVFWRITLCCSIIYELALIFLLFQTADEARRWLSFLDPKLGKELPEQDYGGNCLLYDPDHADPLHNMWDKCDVFVFAHFAGWLVKALILRDYWLLTTLSISFEVLEYSLQHQLPNFSECWWDHWFLDVVLCNGVGIFIGMKVCKHLEMKHYNWRNLWAIEGSMGKLKRMIQQFTPHSWRKFNWKSTTSTKRWLFTLAVIFFFSLAELNVFYLKSALWIPPPHQIVLWRLLFMALWGSVATRESFEYMENSNVKRFGQQAWVIVCIIITEILICFRFSWDTMIKPPPQHIIVLWSFIIVACVGYTCWLLFRDVFLLPNARTQSVSNLAEKKEN